MRTLELAMHKGSVAVIGMVPVQWGKMLAGLPRAPAFLEAFAPRQQAAAHGTTGFVSGLAHMAAGERASAIEAKVIGIVKEHVGVEVRAGDAFQAAGVDSLAMVEVSNVLRRELGSAVKISNTTLLDYPTASSLAEYAEACLFATEDPHASDALQLGGTYLNEGIAVVGMSCYAPGGCSTPGELWELLCSGHDCLAKIPISRFDVDALEGTVQELYVKHGHFVEGVERFDNEFFGIGATEASRN